MGPLAIKVDNVGKKYRLGHAQDSYPTLRETLAGLFSRKRGNDDQDWFWALRDISFQVASGEVLGIVGTNGAGKSTLLKILSRIVEPTVGRVAVNGRVGSLLEVGAGFHPELTGRENIFLNGAILGMSRQETASKLDEIIAFSGIEKFIDLPVKRYSNGMFLRLGFAVAAHIDPDILIVDEVLGVGDATFQAKCITKVGELVKEGRTVLVVSHVLPVVQKLCSRAILIRGGVVAADGTPDAVIADHLRALEEQAKAALAERTTRVGSGARRLSGIDVSGPRGHMLVAGEPAEFRFQVSGTPGNSHCSFVLLDEMGQAVTSFDTAIAAAGEDPVALESGIFRCTVPQLPVRPGRYRIDVAVRSLQGAVEDEIEGAAFVEILSGTIDGRPVEADSGNGNVAVAHRWSFS